MTSQKKEKDSISSLKKYGYCMQLKVILKEKKRNIDNTIFLIDTWIKQLECNKEIKKGDNEFFEYNSDMIADVFEEGKQYIYEMLPDSLICELKHLEKRK